VDRKRFSQDLYILKVGKRVKLAGRPVASRP
jgi:hypothetical protein